MELSELKIKCGFICALSALSSLFASCISRVNFSASFLRMDSNRTRKTINMRMVTAAAIVILNHQVFQTGGRILNENVAGSLFHKPSLLQLMTLKTYLPAERFE